MKKLNNGCEYKERLEVGVSGWKLLDYLSDRYDHSSEEVWRKRIEDGLVLLDGEVTTPEVCLRQGMTLTWQRAPWQEPEAPQNWRVLHDDGEVLAVEKPSGLPTLPGAGFLQSTLLYLVQREFAEAVPAHRLGRWTSGVVLFARTQQARSSLAAQFADRTIDKRYRALASGLPVEDRFEVDAPIGPVPHPLLGTVHAASTDGRVAQSRIAVRQRRENAFLCDVSITTGRPHQIRIHLAVAGFPLVGDPLYPLGGVPRPDTKALPGDGGYSLHAAEISFHSGSQKKQVCVVSKPPAALRSEAAPRS